jgi:ketosteroid isomerase-like protein
MQDPDETQRSDALEASVREWVGAWGDEVAAVRMSEARRRFSPDVVAFGTYAEIVRGIDALETEQWRNVWPTISRFRFRLDELVVLASADACQAVAVVPWDSVGIADDGTSYARPGRATIVLRRDSTTGRWLGVHTHFSLAPSLALPGHAGR